jgi:tetratricopeptide (TPR) repeat protein
MSQLILQFVILIALAAQMSSSNASISAALAELEKGHILESIQQFKQIVRTDPANEYGYFYLATLYTQMSEYAVAERYLQRAIEINPKQGAYYHQFGLIRYRQKQWHAALDLFQRALEVGAGNNAAAVWRSIGDVQLELFDRDAALQAYMQALRLQPRNAQTHLALGRFYLDRGDPAAAIEHIRGALEIDPSLRDALSLLGRAYRQADDFPSAAGVLKKALEANPADQDSRYLLGRTLLAMDRTDEGREELDKYDRIRQQVASADANYKNALPLIDAGKLQEAEKLLLEAVRLAPAYGPALHSLGALWLDHGSPEKALPFLSRAAEANPLNAETWYSVASAYFKMGKMTEAMDAAKRAVVLNEDEDRYQRLLGDVQERLKK